MLFRVRSRLLLGFLLLPVIACEKSEGPTAPTPPTTPYYAAIGASDATGHGASIECAPFDLGCENGTGYAQRIIRRLRQERGNTEYRNTGVPGQVLNRALEDLARQLGRDTSGNFIDRQAPFVRPETTMVTIFAGGNDANVIGEAIRQGHGGTDPRAFIDARVQQWGSDFGAMINTIHGQAPSARIVVLNVPNLGLAPYVAGLPVLERSILQRITVGLADQANALTSRGVLIVDLMCEPRIYNAGNFSSDGFHPNDNGYALIADLAFPAVANGVATGPQPNCQARTQLPAY